MYNSISYTSFQIVLVGEIMEVNESPTNMMYKIDDRTGPWVEVRKWMDENVRGEGVRGVGRDRSA